MDKIIPTFKIHLLGEKGNEHIYVMGNFPDDSIDKLWKSDPNNIIFDEIIGQEEKKIYQNNNLTFIDLPIHLDDKIGTIKLKISKALNSKYSSEEMYLYGVVKQKLDNNFIYQILTQNKQLTLNKLRLTQFMLNLKDINNQSIPFNIEDKSEYTFEDILKLNLNSGNYFVARPLGQKLLFSNEYPFIVNPFQIKEFDSFLENSRKEISTSNNELLLNTQNLVNNNIYLCLAGSVFNYISTLQLKQNFTSKIYFPFLNLLNVENSKDLDKQKKNLIKNTKNQLNNSTLQSFKIIDDFYRISINSKQSDKFQLIEKGIKNFYIEIIPPFKMNLPIENIFKLINADIIFPLIKYNPSIKKENIYRLYSSNLSTKGEKIPYLNKALIFKLIKAIGKDSTISFYTEIQINTEKIPIIIEIFKNAKISIYNFQEFTDFLDISSINQIIQSAFNPLVDKLKSILQQGGYDLQYYKSILDENINIKDISFHIKYKISKDFKFNNISSCFKTLFITESDNFKEGMKLRYKRVSNFSEYDSQQAFIIENQNKNVSIEQIIEMLLENFSDLDKDSATDLVLSIANEEQVVKGSFKNKGISIKQNPGFRSLINYFPISNEAVFSIHNINDIKYIDLIFLYVDAIVRITQDIKSTGLNVSNLEKLCSSKKIEDQQFDDLVALSEQTFFENETPVIRNDQISYQQIEAVADIKDNNMDELLDALGFDDYESSDDETMVGGINEESSDSLPEFSLSSNNSNKSSPALSESKVSSLAKEDIVIEEDSPALSESKVSSPAKEDIVIEEDSKVSSPAKEDIVIEEDSPALSESKVSSQLKEDIVIEEDSKVSSPALSESKASSPAKEDIVIEEDSPAFLESKVTSPVKEDIVIAEDSPALSESKVSSPAKEDIVIEEEIKNQSEGSNSSEKSEYGTRLKKSVEGVKLSNPYYFQALLEKKDPKIFLSLRDGKFDGYSRMCPSSTRRQPVIMDQKDIDELAKEKNNGLMGEFKNGNYEGPDLLKYGSSPNKNNYYMCPKYWCLLTNKPLTEKQVDEGECGGKEAIIPKNAKIVSKGKSIYQFYEDNKNRYPGFHKELTPNGLCIPCCYKIAQTKKRQHCIQDENEIDIIDKKDADKDQYIKGPEKFPLGDGRWGFLPTQVNFFLNDINMNCKTSKSSITKDSDCILRLGVENNDKKSFIACMATILFYGITDAKTKNYKIKSYFPQSNNVVPTIKQMIEIILNSINIKDFDKYQNGNLLDLFSLEDLDTNKKRN